MNLIEVRVAGIPATVRVVDYVSVKGSFSHNAPSDVDYYGFEEIDYEICDRRGRPAPWLADKATDLDREKIEEAIREDMRDDDYYDERD